MSNLYYGTFGASHLYGLGLDKYIVIEADSTIEACCIMYKLFAQKWCTVYESPEEAGVNKYNLSCINVHGRPITAKRAGLIQYED